ncbi:MAG: serpin family protein, partial [Gemmatimonadetes bacterium]|nr:serpin family protein [Gemmatimonadota bacterium]NIO30810.1 serpin family protein [Gemmatimonadota bacterium]
MNRRRVTGRRIIATALLLLVAGVLAQCDSDATGPPGDITGLPRDLTAAEQGLIAADNAFGLKLFREIHAQEEPGSNLFVSPLSVAMALAMTYNGADGATQLAMQETLELQGLTIDEVNQSYRSLIDLLDGLDPSVAFLLANSIWPREGFTVEPDFLAVNQEYYEAEVSVLDFSDPNAAPTINDWVFDKTNGKIESIVPDPIPGNVVMYLINAIYFKGDWTLQFDPELTADGPFTLSDGSQKQVPMMAYPDVIEVGYFWDGEVQAVDLTYGGKAYSMTIVLPAAGGEIGALVESLDAARWAAIIDGLAVREIDVRMPKFELEYEITLNDVLIALGMGVAFGPGADFSKIAPGIWIGEVKHKSFVEVNEEGTEAAAVTSV